MTAVRIFLIKIIVKFKNMIHAQYASDDNNNFIASYIIQLLLEIIVLIVVIEWCKVDFRKSITKVMNTDFPVIGQIIQQGLINVLKKQCSFVYRGARNKPRTTTSSVKRRRTVIFFGHDIFST